MLVDHHSGRNLLLLVDHGEETGSVDADLCGQVAEHRPVRDRAVLREVGLQQSPVKRVGRVGSEPIHHLGGHLRRNAACGARIVGCPYLELGVRLRGRRSQPRLGVLHELGLIRYLRLSAQKERFPLDLDLVTERLRQLFDTNRADVAPRSKEVGPHGQRDRLHFQRLLDRLWRHRR